MSTCMYVDIIARGKMAFPADCLWRARGGRPTPARRRPQVVQQPPPFQLRHPLAQLADLGLDAETACTRC